MIPNAPPWVAGALVAALPQIESVLGPDFLPEDGRFPAGPDVLGHGAFGYVMRARKPGVVMKLTIDGSEAFLCEALRQVGRMPGLPHYIGEAVRIACRGEKAWIVWRKDTPPPTLQAECGRRDSRVSARYRTYEHAAAEAMRAGEGRDLWRELDQKHGRLQREEGAVECTHLEGLNSAGLGIASQIAHRMRSGRASIADVQRQIKSAGPWAERVFQPYFGGHFDRWRYSLDPEARDPGYPYEVALRLLGYEFHLDNLAIGTLMPDLARSLLRLKQEGIVILDVQADAISAAGEMPTLFDGGLTLPVHSRWGRLWEQVGAQPIWWDHDARTRAWEAWMK